VNIWICIFHMWKGHWYYGQRTALPLWWYDMNAVETIRLKTQSNTERNANLGNLKISRYVILCRFCASFVTVELLCLLWLNFVYFYHLEHWDIGRIWQLNKLGLRLTFVWTFVVRLLQTVSKGGTSEYLPPCVK